MKRSVLCLLAATLLTGTTVRAAADGEPAAAPASLALRFDGIDSARYELVDAQFFLDGAPLPHALPMGLKGPTQLPVFSQVVSPGPHVVFVRVVYKPVKTQTIFTYVDDVKFKVPGKVTLEAVPGIRHDVWVRVATDEQAKELTKRMRFVSEVHAQLLAPPAEPLRVAGRDEPRPPLRTAASEPLAEPTASHGASAPLPAPAAISVAALPPPTPARSTEVAAPVPLPPRPSPAAAQRHRLLRLKKSLAAAAPDPEAPEPGVSSRALRSLLHRARKAARAE